MSVTYDCCLGCGVTDFVGVWGTCSRCTKQPPLYYHLMALGFAPGEARKMLETAGLWW